MNPQNALLKETFRQRMETDPEYRHWALVDLYEHQTEDEQAEERTIYRNGVGFNSGDDKILTGLAEEYLAGNTLTTEDEEELRKRLPKYWKQFPDVAAKKGASGAVVTTKEAA